ncbi:hypothetical protein SLA2020_371520 [Shorea laevis]
MKTCGYFAAMILVQVSYGASNILIKISLEQGMNQFVFVVYRHIIAFLLLGPFAYVLEKKERPKLTPPLFAKIFVLSALGTTIHLNVYYAGLAYTSPTVASALSNVIPSLTFLMAVLFRMEKVKITSARGQAKVLGTVICICGSLVFTFWKGGYGFNGFVDRPLINIYTSKGVGESRHRHENWIMGSALILTSHIAWSAWLILQALLSKVYPARLSLTVLICFIASLQSSLLSMFFARNPVLWRLDWNLSLLTIIYAGTMISVLSYFLQIWCISNKGPVFASMFSPLLVLIVGISSAICFAERFHLGSLVGALLIIVGLYCVLWGKKKDDSATPTNTEAEDQMLEVAVIGCPAANDHGNE